MATSMNKVECKVCGFSGHFLEPHLTGEHGLTVDDYLAQYPGAPVLSKAAKARLDAMYAGLKNGRKQFDIAETFGLDVFAAQKHMEGYAEPLPNTPAVDEGYIFQKEVLGATLYALSKPNEFTLFRGPTGCGKSSNVTQVVARLNRPCYRVNFDNEITRGDFVGQWVMKGDRMVFQYGILPRAMMEGAVLILDEWDAANPGVSLVLQSVMEPGGKLTITETGEVIEPAAGFCLFGTANTGGMGDETGLYHGTQPQNFASLNRWAQVVEVDYPERDAELAIVEKKSGLTDRPTLEKLAQFAELVRRGFKNDETRVTVSTRNMINLAAKIVDFGDVRLAFRLGFLNAASGDDRAFVEEVFERVWA